MNRFKKIALPFILSSVLIAGVVGCGTNDTDESKDTETKTEQADVEKDKPEEESDTAGMRKFTDQAGNEVEIPEKIEKVADLWDAHSQVMLLLGQADKLVSTTERIHNTPWYAEVAPQIKDVSVVSKDDEIQIEELIKLNPDVVICLNEAQKDQVESAGLKAVQFGFQDFDGLKETVRLTGELMGAEAQEKAEEYISYLEGNIEKIAEKTKDVTDEERPKVLHIFGGEELTKVDGEDSIIGEWIKLAGGTNSIKSVANHVDVSIEEIIATNPDVIIVGGTGAEKGIEKIKEDGSWAEVSAVKEDRIYANPVGTWKWDRYSAEEALQVLWAAKLIHPDKFDDIDMVKETKEFYKKFYDFDLTDDQAQKILDNDNPEGVGELKSN